MTTGGASSSVRRVLVVDDEKNVRSTLSVCLESMSCEATAVASGAAALDMVSHAPFDLAFVDLRLVNESGLDLIPKLLAELPGLPIVVITAYASFDSAVEAVRGALARLALHTDRAAVRLDDLLGDEPAEPGAAARCPAGDRISRTPAPGSPSGCRDRCRARLPPVP